MDAIKDAIVEVSSQMGRDLQLDTISKICKELKESPDKLRVIFHLCMSPGRQPEYCKYQGPSLLGIQNAYIQQPADNGEEPPRPLHMINVRTGNMVSGGDVGLQSAYCVLSHRWQGDEVMFATFGRAREEALSRVWVPGEEVAKDDVHMVLDHCRREVVGQYGIVKELLCQASVKTSAQRQVESLRQHQQDTIGDGPELQHMREQASAVSILQTVIQASHDAAEEAKKHEADTCGRGVVPDATMVKAIEGLLVLECRARQAKEDYRAAQKKKISETRKYYVDTMETELFKDVIEKVVKKINEPSTQSTQTNASTGDPGTACFNLDKIGTDAGVGSGAHSNNVENTCKTQQIVELSEETYNAATQREEQARVRCESANGCVDQLDRYLRHALGMLTSRLQLWQSAIKLKKAVTEARRLFETHLFPVHEECYLWSDTCCINKSDSGEYATSISLMGDWYQNAEFCLAHLDLPAERPERAASDWTEFWAVDRSFAAVRSAQAEEEVHLIRTFDDFLDRRQNREERVWPDWIKRGWTLQELVMSRLVFFSNAVWDPLPRPIEGLGYIYPLVPLVGLYTSQVERLHGTKDSTELMATDEEITAAYNMLWAGGAKQCGLVSNGIELHCQEQSGTPADVKKAQQLAMILHGLGFSFPVDMTPQTAGPTMVQAVRLAAIELHSLGSTATASATSALRQRMLGKLLRQPFRLGETDEPIAAERLALNRLLYTLVTCTEEQIQKDRHAIACASGIQDLAAWSKGLVQSGFPAQQILALSCDRTVSVPTDRAYSLMGILGVRFQTFPAEGLPRALARLLDEVVLATNDVSVFNWAGTDMCSTIQGRSMYPASHLAYRHRPEDRAMQYNQLLSQEVQRKQADMRRTSDTIVHMLRAAIRSLQKANRRTLPLNLLNAIVSRVKYGTLASLKPHVLSLHNILLYIADQSTVRKSLTGDKNEKTGKNGKGRRLLSLASELRSSIKLPRDRITADSLSDDTASTATTLNTDETGDWKLLTEAVLKDGDPLHNSQLPQRLLDNIKRVAEKEEEQAKGNTDEYDKNTRRDSGEHNRNGRDDSALKGLISPNPIIVNSAGIESIFDIQRVVVTMLDRDGLRQMAENAVHANQVISGWCIISTGFAMVAVNFACEKHILEAQLNAISAVKDMIANSHHVRLWQTIQSMRAEKVEGKGSGKGKEAADRVLGMRDAEVRQDGQETDDDEADGETDDPATKREEDDVLQAIRAIQEPDLTQVAGEWVLARFSGVAKADWFLCRLELGTTHQFYGRRIATSKMDFAHATMEPGILSAWRTYTERKKDKMCHILEYYGDSGRFSRTAVDGLSRGQAYVAKAGAIADQLVGNGSRVSLSLSHATAVDERTDEADRPTTTSTALSQLLGNSTNALKHGSIALLSEAISELCKLRADHLDKHLASAVLKKTRRGLRPAILGLDKNGDMMPSMYHGSQKVHMF